MIPNNKRKNRRNDRRKDKPEFEQKMLDLARVTRVVKGGRRFRFRATVVAGNRKGKVGVGVAKGTDVSQAIQKAFADAKKNMVTIQLDGTTISHEIMKKHGAAKIFLSPAPEGRGIIAGGAVRTVVDLLGVKDIVSKSMGTANKLNVARATVAALTEIAVPKAAPVKEADATKESTEATDSPTAAAAPKKTAAAKTVAKAAPATDGSDDFTKIEGVGPSITQALNTGGLKTFKDIANATPKFISGLIEGIRGNHDAKTWPKQAELASQGKWDELEKLQEELHGGVDKA